MFHLRKNFDGAWKLFSLNKEEYQSVSKSTVKTGLKALIDIRAISKEKGIELTPLQEVGMLIYYGLQVEHLASDLVESQEKAKREALLKAATPTADPENQPQ